MGMLRDMRAESIVARREGNRVKSNHHEKRRKNREIAQIIFLLPMTVCFVIFRILSAVFVVRPFGAMDG